MIALTERLQRRLRLRHEESVASTNSALLEEAEQGTEEGLVLLADRQTRGRGRQGRSWIAPGGCGLTFSILRRPPVAAAEAVRWTLLAGVASLEAIQGELAGAWLKWPNDLYFGDRKLGGILCERSDGGQPLRDALVVGLGMNLRAPPGGWPEELIHQATSLREELRGDMPEQLARGALFNRILERFLDHEDRLILDGPERLMHCYRTAIEPMLGREVVIERKGHPQAVKVVGVQDSGALEVLDGKGTRHAVVAGDVHLGSL